VIVPDGAGFKAKDSDGRLHPIIGWDMAAMMAFKNAFQRGENIWNWQFVLITPRTYDGFDFQTMGGRGWLVRPNVLCLFRLKAGGSPTHRRITVVRLDPSVASKSFRSNVDLYDHLDVWSPTLGHELGHALGMGHIKELLGDGQCIADAKLGHYPPRCYGETPVERANIMGGGAAIYLLNAKPWHERIAEHTLPPKSAWGVTGVMETPTRKVPLGATLVGATPTVF
jgi:hypothetical protein